MTPRAVRVAAHPPLHFAPVQLDVHALAMEFHVEDAQGTRTPNHAV